MAANAWALRSHELKAKWAAKLGCSPYTSNNPPPDLTGTSDDTLVPITVLYTCISVKTVKLNFHLDMELRLNFN
jgi:hypothetical protein